MVIEKYETLILEIVTLISSLAFKAFGSGYFG